METHSSSPRGPDPAARTSRNFALLLYIAKFLENPKTARCGGLPGCRARMGNGGEWSESQNQNNLQLASAGGERRGDPWRPGRRCRVQAISVKCNQDVDMRPSGNNHITFYCNDLQSVPRSPPECAEFAAHKLRLLIRNICRLRIGRMYHGQ